MNRRVGRAGIALLASAIVAVAAACADTSEPYPPPASAGIPATVSLPTSVAQSSATPLSTASAVPSVKLLPTQTPTLASTATPFNTPSPSQTASPTSIATKQVLLQLGRDPGDGGGVLPDPFGRFTPPLVLYTDGELLIQASRGGFSETVLSTAQVCSLLRQLTETGFFQVEGTGELREDDPIYDFAAVPERSMGAPELAIQVNGNQAQYVTIYEPYEDKVVSPIKAALRLLTTYRPAGLMPYRPSRLLVWVDAGRDLFEIMQSSDDGTPTATPQVQVWPADLPPLDDWWDGTDYNRVFIQGDLVEPVLNLNLPQHYGVFSDRGLEYTIFVTALLPHATLDDYGYHYPRDAKQFDLPFSCEN